MASGATGVKFELIDVDETQEKKKPSGDAVVSIQFEGTETELNEDSETHGSSERQVHTASDSARVDWDGAAERTNRGRDIYWYIWEDDQEAIRGLLQKNKGKNRQVKMKDSHGYAPVHYAAKFNRPKIMRILVDDGADIKAKTVSEEYTPLHLAACYLRHASKPCKSEKPGVTKQLDTAKELDKSSKRTRSDTDGTLGPPRNKDRRSSSAPDPTHCFERQTSCKEIFDYLITDCKEIDVNAIDRYGFTALHIACQSGNIEAVESLLDHEDIDVNVKDGNGDTPLHEACFHGHNEIVRALLDKMKWNGKPVNTKCKNNAGLTPFHIACREDQYKIVELLLEKCPKFVNEGDNDNAIPLHYACQNDSVSMVKLLMNKYDNSYNVSKTSDGVTPIHVAAQYGCVKVMEEFLKREREVVNVCDTYNQTPLHYATEYGKTDMMILLLNSDADIEAEDVHSFTPLLTAAEYGQVESFELLLNRGAMLVDREDSDVVVKCKDRKTVLFLAAEHNHPKIIELTLTNRSEGHKLYKTTDTSFNTCLHIAAQNGHLECVKVLWNHRDELGLILQKKNALLKTAMHLAVENGHNHIITELQRYWEDIVNQHKVTADVGRLLKSADDNGNTPLHLACKYGFVDIAKTLIKMPGANIGARNKVLWTPLDCAAASGHARVIKELVSAKAEIDPTDKLKTTPLHLAAKEGHVTAVETLIKHGANVGLRDQRGFNALDWAIEKGHRDVAEAIITSPQWKLALRNCTEAQDKSKTTPFRKLIQRMPDVAQLVLKKCTTTNAKDGGTCPDCKDYAVTFSYEFIEDSRDAKEWKPQNKMESDDETTSNPLKVKSKVIHYFQQKRQKLKHPLRIMVESKRTELLKHPLIYSLIDHKWKYEMVAAYFYLTLVFGYLLFAILLTTFALKLPNPLSPTCAHQESAVNVSQLPSSARDVVTKILVNQNSTISYSTDGIFSREDLCNLTRNSNESLVVEVSEMLCGSHVECSVQSKFLAVSPWFLVVFCIIRVFRKMWKCRLIHRFNYHHIGEYIDDTDFATLVKIPLTVCTIVFVAGVHGNKCLCPLEWQWQVGIVAVFLSWADVVLYMRKLRLMDTGLYVVMFQSIFKTFIRAMILTITLIIMFAVAFRMTFYHFHSFFKHSPFTNMLQSTWKTMTMTTGEMGFEEIFHVSTGGSDSDIPPILFPEISYILWVIFLIIMPILFINLLVGLAVDDIKAIQEAATLERLKMRVDLILALEASLPHHKLFKPVLVYLQKYLPGFRNTQSLHEHRELTVYPNKWSFYSLIPKSLVGENYSSAEHLSLELNPTMTPADQAAQNLMLEISKIQEMLLSMNEELKGLRAMKEPVRELSEKKAKEQATPPTPGPGPEIRHT